MTEENRTKFTAKFKREVVREYNKGGITLAALAEKHEGVTASMVAGWKDRAKRIRRRKETHSEPAPTPAKVTPKRTDKPVFILTGQTVAELRTQLDRLEALRG